MSLSQGRAKYESMQHAWPLPLQQVTCSNNDGSTHHMEKESEYDNATKSEKIRKWRDSRTNRRNDRTTTISTEHTVLSLFQRSRVEVTLGQITDAKHLPLSADATALRKCTPTGLHLTAASHKRDYVFEFFPLRLLNILHKPHSSRSELVEIGEKRLRFVKS